VRLRLRLRLRLRCELSALPLDQTGCDFDEGQTAPGPAHPAVQCGFAM